MESSETNKSNTYHILVKENRSNHRIGWTGILSIITEQNGEAFLDISFTDQELIQDSPDQPRNCDYTLLSIDCFET